MTFVLSSPAFAAGGPIPRQHTCQGADTSPPLRWSGAPRGTRSYALIVDDPDAPDPAAPRMIWAHWLVYNLPAGTQALPADASGKGLPSGARQGLNDWERAGYGGPCPPVGRHRYVHTLYALDGELPDLGQPTRQRLLEALRGHVLAEAQLVGTYQKAP